MGLVFGNAICNQFLRNRIPGFFQIPCDFFLLGLLRGKRRGQLPDLLHTEDDVCRNFFLRVGMVKERLQQPADFLPLGRIVKLPGDVLHCLGVIFTVAHAGTVKLPDQAQYLGCQRWIGVCGFFFLRLFLHFRRRVKHRRVLGGGNGHFRGIGNPLDLLPHRLGHFLIVNLHRAVGGDVGYCFVISVFFLQPVPNSQTIPQMSIAQVIGFFRGHGGGRRLLVFRKERKGALTESREVFKSCFPPLIHPVILRGRLPHRHHHLIDFFHAGRVVKLRLDELYRVPIIKAIGVRMGLLLRHILKKGTDVPGKLVFLILRHGGPVVVG